MQHLEMVTTPQLPLKAALTVPTVSSLSSFPPFSPTLSLPQFQYISLKQDWLSDVKSGHLVYRTVHWLLAFLRANLLLAIDVNLENVAVSLGFLPGEETYVSTELQRVRHFVCAALVHWKTHSIAFSTSSHKHKDTLNIHKQKTKSNYILDILHCPFQACI